MYKEETLQEWFRIIMICVLVVMTTAAFVIGYNMGKSSHTNNNYTETYDFLYNETLGDPGEPIRHFDYKKQTRTTCYTISRTCRVERLNIIK